MIVIFSKSGLEETTNLDMEWVDALGGSFVRINGDQFSKVSMGLEISSEGNKGAFSTGNKTFEFKDIGAVWYRRTGHQPLPFLGEVEDINLRRAMVDHLFNERKAARLSFYNNLNGATWLSSPKTSSPNKADMLIKASELGIDVPRTLITDNKADLKRFRADAGPIIIKCISDTQHFHKDGALYNHYTEILDEDTIDAMKDRFFPILVQECIEKQYEIRTFYFRGDCYSMAIFSQGDKQTQVDFRVYNYRKRSRSIPFKLPQSLSEKVDRLMEAFGLETGSLDFIKGVDGAFHFLEINPVGQFGMVSHPCNYGLEKMVAEYLVEKDVA